MLEITWDLETENLNLGLCRPWQLAFTVAEKGYIKEEYNLRIDIHDLNISNDAARITGFNWDEHNQEKIPATHVIDIFEPYALNPENRLISHNGLGYDIYILKNLYNYAGRELDFNKILYNFYDTLCIARAQHFESQCPKDRMERLAWQYKHLHKYDKAFKGSLAACAKRNDIEVDTSKTHDALYDVKLTYQLFKKLEYATELV